MDPARQKNLGAYYTPDAVVKSLVSWVVRTPTDRLLDPSCGDGRFLREHSLSVGIEQDPASASIAHRNAPGSLVHEGDFFTWAATTHERFECVAGNPPFIRYQRFCRPIRDAALRLCQKQGVAISALCSSWAPFLVAAASLIKPGGRMAFVIPAEIGHASYAQPVLNYLLDSFATVQVVAIRKKLFPKLSEDCWMLYASGRGRKARYLRLSLLDKFKYLSRPPASTRSVVISRQELAQWDARLRPFFMDSNARQLYREFCIDGTRLADIATVGIGYVTGANDFFHLRPSEARQLRIPSRYLLPSVRNGRVLPTQRLTKATVASWHSNDDPYLLLRIEPGERLGKRVSAYLESDDAEKAQRAFKCRSRDPWYSVQNVSVPNAFLTSMSGEVPALVENSARCVGTNSVHAVYLNRGESRRDLIRAWKSQATRLSCEVEGHPLGGGMLKLEPSRASRVLVDTRLDLRGVEEIIARGIETMRQWRDLRN